MVTNHHLISDIFSSTGDEIYARRPLSLAGSITQPHQAGLTKPLKYLPTLSY